MRRASLNHSYRLVWSECNQAYVAVAETTRSNGKKNRAGVVLALLLSLGISMSSFAAGVAVAPASGFTNVYNAPNGVPVVNIDKANAAGLSHNKYTDYNVTSKGLILNNANSSQVSRNSQLAGQILANPNLSTQARVILNEVVTTNRSQLLGYTEVVGGRADVIVANPYGITCNGCGFINTDRVTLTTGTPNITAGALTGFTVNRGDVLIEGVGLDGINQNYFDIITRAYRQDAQINAKDLKIAVGNNTWDYVNQTASANSPSGTAPEFAFDSTVLGGMYANRIAIFANETGVGVRMLGEAAASVDDFTLSATGKIDIRSKVSAERHLTLTTTTTGGDAFSLTNANLSARQNLTMTAATGGATISGGAIVAGNNLTANLLSLTDAANSTNVTDNNKRYAATTLSIAVTNAASVDGTSWGTDGNLIVNAGSYSVGAQGAALYAGTTLGMTATTGNLSLATAAIRSVGDMSLTSTSGSISTTAERAQGIQVSTGNLLLTSGNGISNAGVMTADAGSVTVRSSGTVTNSGSLHAHTTINIADKDNTSTENFTNSGTLLADTTLTIKAAAVTNSGSMQGTTGSTVTATSLDNSGTFITSNTVDDAGVITLASLTNSGIMQSAKDLSLNVSTSLANSGKLLATHNLNIDAASAALAITNTSPGIMQAGNALNVTGANATFDTQSGTVLGNTVGITVSSLNNSGTLQSNAAMTYAVGHAVTNSGTLLAKTTLTGSSASVDNSGTMQSDTGASITATGAITNSGTLNAAAGLSYNGVLTAATLSNTSSGVVQSSKNLTLSLSGASLTNAGKILADDDLTITSTGSGLTINNNSGAYIQAGVGIGDDLTIGGTAVTLNNNSGSVMLGKTNTLTISSLTNAGTLQSEENTTYTVANAVVNTGTLLVKGLLTGSSASLNNSGTFEADRGASVTATNAITNSGTFILSNGSAYTGVVNSATLANTGVMQSGRDLFVNLSGASLTNSGKILANDDLTIASTGSGLTLTNSSGGYIQAGTGTGDDLNIGGVAVALNNNSGGVILGKTNTLTLTSLTNGGTLQSEANTVYTATGAVTNTGTFLAKGSLTGSSASLNNSGTFEADLGATITTSGAMANSGTFILSNDALYSATLTATTLTTTAGTVQSARNLTINLSGSSLTNAGKILADDDLTITSTGSGLTLTNSSGGYIQAGTGTGDDLTIGGTAVTLNNNSGGVILGKTNTLTLASLTNGGTLQSEANTTYTVTNDVANTGTLFVKGALTGTSASLNNSGTLEADLGADITTTGAITNSGTFIASNNSAYSSTLTAATLTTTAGTIQSAHNLTINLSATSLTNAGKILADDDLTINSTGSGLTLTNSSGGYIQAGTGTNDDLTIGGVGHAITISNAGTLIGDKLAFTAPSLTNTGTVQGGAGASTIDVTNTLTNSGTFSLADTISGGGTINADTITNSGTLQSQGSANLNVATTITNSGSLLTSGAMTIRGTDSAYTINNTSRMQSGGLMDIKGQTAGRGVDITLGASGVMLGDSMDVKAGTLTLSNSAIVGTSNALTLDLTTLSFGGSTSRIVAATSGTGEETGEDVITATITLANGFDNPGIVHSGDVLTFSAPSVTNSNTGGMSALGTLNINATAGNLSNAGALYAGHQLTLATSATFTNTATDSAPEGTLDSGGNINITALTFINNSTINAAGNIDISATTFNNEVRGGDTRVWHEVSRSSEDRTSTNAYYDFPDDYETQYWQQTWRREQYYSGGTPAFKPQIIGGSSGAITIHNFSTATNVGSVISAGTINLTGNDSATFTNNDLALNYQNWKKTWEIYTHWIALGPLTYDDHVRRNDSGDYQTDTGEVSNIGAGVYAGTLNATGFSLVNAGSAFSASVNSSSAAGASGASLASGASGTSGGSGATGATGTTGGSGASGASGTSGGSSASGASGTSGGSAVSGVRTSGGASAISFGGLVITLPTNPNGYFVRSKDPNARYLVETNPLFGVGQNSIGSDYIAKRLGLNVDTIVRRLGDSAYEGYLIRQQLIAQTGKNILSGYDNEQKMLASMFDAAAGESAKLNLAWGQALSPDQIKNLKQDIVWMVETIVDGQKILSPVVYLAQATKDVIETGAVIAANNVNLNLTSVTNTGGTISGKNTLNIKTTGDITNTSGTIKGGDVSLVSTQGSIKNETLTVGGGNSKDYSTTVGKTAGIQATGNLTVDAAKDITVKGGQVSAGKDASLTAGGNVTFDTVENKQTSTTRAAQDTLLSHQSTETTTTTVNQVKSALTTGGNLTIKSKNDITLAGTDTKVGGNADLDAGGNVKLLARTNTVVTHSTSDAYGIGVGGVVGGQTSTTDTESGRNVGSTLTVGGDASIKAKNDITVQGSTVDVKGNGKVDAGNNINILAGNDYDKSRTTTETNAFLKADSGEGVAGSSAGPSSGSGFGNGASGANADASANAQAGGSGGLKLSEKTKNETTKLNIKSVGSSLNFGGNADVTAGKTLTLKGSELNAGGDVNVNAKDIKVLAAQNVSTSSSKTTVTSIGLMADSNNKAGAQADADAMASSGNARAGNGKIGVNESNLGAGAGAQASAQASTDNKLTLMNTTTTTKDDLTITNVGSSIKSGGNAKITASNKLTTVGSSIESGGSLDVKAKEMEFLAAIDVKETRTTKDSTSLGLYAGGNADASAKASADARGSDKSAGGEVSAGAGAEVGIGLYGSNTQSSSTKGSTTAQVSSLKSGANMTRTADGKIVDEGTKVTAGGDFSQSAAEIDSRAVSNTTYSSSSSTTHTAKIGLYAEAGASAEASGGAGAATGVDKPTGSAEAGYSYGVQTKYEYSSTGSSSSTSKAVTSNITAGGSVSSTSSGKTSLEGTNISAGKDINLSAGSLDYKAAQDTSTSSKSKTTAEAELKVGQGATTDGANKSASLSGGYGDSSSSRSFTTAVVGSLGAGGNININTKGDAKLEGTNLDSKKDINLKVGGNLDVTAARDTSTSTDNSFGVSASLSGAKTGSGDSTGKAGGVGVAGAYGNEKSSSSDAVVSNINSGGKLNISAGNNASFEGTNLKAAGDATVSAKGDLTFSAARNTESSEGINAGAKVGVSGFGSDSGTSSSSKVKVAASVDYQKNSSDTAVTGSLSSGGNLKLSSGKDITLEGTDVSSTGKTSIAATGNVNIKAAESTTQDASVGLDMKVRTTNKSKTDSSGSTSTNTDTIAQGRNNSVQAGVGSSTTSKGARIKSGDDLSVSSGANATFVGTSIESGGNTKIAATGDVQFKAAESTSSNANIGVSFSDSSAGISRANIGDETNKQGVTIKSANNLNVSSGGVTQMQGTQASAGGRAEINAVGGVQQEAASNSGGAIGTGGVGVNLGTTATNVGAKGGVAINTGMAAQAANKAPVIASVQIPANLPPGKTVEVKTASGKPLPTWVKFDPTTGAFSGTPPADFKGVVDVVVKIPQADGGVKDVVVKFEPK